MAARSGLQGCIQRLFHITLPQLKRTLAFVLVADTAINFLFFAPAVGPALGWLALASMITAPFGAKTTHSAQAATLRKLFVILLYCLAIKMLLELFG